MFYWFDDQERLMGVLASHVDDFIWSGTEEFESTVIDSIRSRFNIGKEDSDAFQYVGIGLACEEEYIYLHQHDYASNMSAIQIDKARMGQKESSLTDRERELLRD